jgi:hypothetical protein
MDKPDRQSFGAERDCRVVMSALPPDSSSGTLRCLGTEKFFVSDPSVLVVRWSALISAIVGIKHMVPCEEQFMKCI